MPCKGIRKSRQDFPADSVDGVLMVPAIMKKKLRGAAGATCERKAPQGQSRHQLPSLIVNLYEVPPAICNFRRHLLLTILVSSLFDLFGLFDLCPISRRLRLPLRDASDMIP